MAKKAPNPIDKHVGSRVRMRRMMLSMSQEKLGDALGQDGRRLCLEGVSSLEEIRRVIGDRLS